MDSGKKKGIALLFGPEKKTDEDEDPVEEASESPEEEKAEDIGANARKASAKVLISAVKSGDVDAVDKALKSYWDAC